MEFFFVIFHISQAHSRAPTEKERIFRPAPDGLVTKPLDPKGLSKHK